MIAREGIIAAPVLTPAFALGDPASSEPADAHSNCAVFKRDVAITMAWGMTAGGEYHEPWATCCLDPRARTAFVDIAYHRALVHRGVYVSVDGDRCYLPLPRDSDELHVPFAYAGLTLLLTSLSLGSAHYDVYLRRAGLKLIDVPWPE